MKANVLVLMAACWVTACNGQATIGSTPELPQTSSSESVTCPSEDFREFLTSFVDDVQVQRAFTATPLHVESVDASAEPEPRQVTRMLSGVEIEFPVIPDSRLQSSDGLVQEIDEGRNGEMQLRMSKPDTDYQVTYHFRKEACWRLFRKVDDSL